MGILDRQSSPVGHQNCHICYHVMQLSIQVSSILHCAPTASQARGNWHGLAVVLGLVLPMSVGLGRWGRLVYNKKHVYLGTTGIQSGQVCKAWLPFRRWVRLSAQGHLASRSNIRHSGKLFLWTRSWNLLAWDR